jgi:hypothetical protein
MKIKQTARGLETTASIPVYDSLPSAPDDDGSGELPLAYVRGSRGLVIFDRQSNQWQAIGGTTAPTQTTFYVDPQNAIASDQANGLTSAAPLKSLSEVARRLAYVTIPSGTSITINLLSDCVSTDSPVWTYQFQPGAASNTDGVFLIGKPTVLYTGTVASYTQQIQSNANTGDNHMVDNSITGGSWTASGFIRAGVIFQRTNSTNLWWFPLKDSGSNTLRISDPLTNATTPVVGTLSASDTYTISSLPKVYTQSFPAPREMQRSLPGRFQMSFCDDRSTNGGSTVANDTLAYINYDRSSISTSRNFTNGRFTNCSYWASMQFIGHGSIDMRGAASVAGNFLIGNGISFTWTLNLFFQGSVFTMGTGGSNANGTRLCFYDNTSACVTLSTPGSVMVLNNIAGSGNTSKLIKANPGTMCIYNAASVPTTADGSTSDGAPLQAAATTAVSAGLPLTSTITTSMCGIFSN